MNRQHAALGMLALTASAQCLLGVFALAPAPVDAQPAAPPAQRKFDPPRIIDVLHAPDTGNLPDSLADSRSYYVNKGMEVNIGTGDILNVYREKQLSQAIPRPLRFFIGTMNIIASQPGSSVGRFKPNRASLARPIIRFKRPIKGDIVVPRLIIDSEVLFDPGSAELKTGAKSEFDKVADFVQNFSPSKLVIEGHTDSDGDAEYNQKLSVARAETVMKFLLNEPSYSEFIIAGMLEAKGYGEERPIANNDTPENKTLNRRIEVIVWE